MCTRISLIQERGSTKLKNLQKFYFNSRNSLNHSRHWLKSFQLLGSDEG